MRPTTPVAMVDGLVSLQEAEQNSVFRFMDEGSPYLSRSTTELRRPLQEMVRTSFRHCHELADAILSLGGTPRLRGVQPEEQHLAYLSFKFLLPKLIDAKKLTIRRYENTLTAFAGGPAPINELLRSHLVDHRSDLTLLVAAEGQTVIPSEPNSRK